MCLYLAPRGNAAILANMAWVDVVVAIFAKVSEHATRIPFVWWATSMRVTTLALALSPSLFALTARCHKQVT